MPAETKQQKLINELYQGKLNNPKPFLYIPGVTQANQAINSGLNTAQSAVTSTVGAAGTFAKLAFYLVDPAHWLRILLIIMGLIMVLFGLKYALDVSRPQSGSTRFVPVPV